MENLWSLPVNKTAIIGPISNELDSKYRQRLLDLGVVEGESVICVRKAPFGGPKVFELGGTLISFDREISENIYIK